MPSLPNEQHTRRARKIELPYRRRTRLIRAVNRFMSVFAALAPAGKAVLLNEQPPPPRSSVNAEKMLGSGTVPSHLQPAPYRWTAVAGKAYVDEAVFLQCLKRMTPEQRKYHEMDRLLCPSVLDDLERRLAGL